MNPGQAWKHNPEQPLQGYFHLQISSSEMPCGSLGFVSEDKGNVLVVEESGFSVFWTRAWQLTASAFLPSWQVGQLAHCKGRHSPSSTHGLLHGPWPKATWSLAWSDCPPSMLKVLLGTLVPDPWSQALLSASSETFKCWVIEAVPNLLADDVPQVCSKLDLRNSECTFPKQSCHGYR